MRSAADEALASAAKTSAAGDGFYVEMATPFYRAISLFKLGKHAEDRELFIRPAGSQGRYSALLKKMKGLGRECRMGRIERLIMKSTSQSPCLPDSCPDLTHCGTPGDARHATSSTNRCQDSPLIWIIRTALALVLGALCSPIAKAQSYTLTEIEVPQGSEFHPDAAIAQLPAPPTFSIADGSAIEPGPGGTVDMVFTVTRAGDPTPPITVRYTTVEGTAQANSEFTPTTGTVTFASGASTATIAVPILNNGFY